MREEKRVEDSFTTCLCGHEFQQHGPSDGTHYGGCEVEDCYCKMWLGAELWEKHGKKDHTAELLLDRRLRELEWVETVIVDVSRRRGANDSMVLVEALFDISTRKSLLIREEIE